MKDTLGLEDYQPYYLATGLSKRNPNEYAALDETWSEDIGLEAWLDRAAQALAKRKPSK